MKKVPKKERPGAKSPAAKPVATSGDQPKSVATAKAAATGGRPPAPPAQVAAPAVPPNDPQPGWTLAQHEACIEEAIQTIRHYDESCCFVTGSLWRLDRSMRLVEALHLYPPGMTFRQWCLNHKITDDDRSRAKGISDVFGSSAEAGQVPLPKAIQKVTEMRAKERGKPKLATAVMVKRKLDALQRQWDEIKTLTDELPNDELEPFGELIVQLGAEVQSLVARVPLPGAGMDLSAAVQLP